MNDLANSSVTNQSTVAAFAILERMVARGEPSRVTDLANDLGMPRARIYRFLQTLLSLGYVHQNQTTERYKATLKIYHLGQAIAEGTQLTASARPVLAALRDEVGQTVTLSLPEEDGMRVLDIVRTESPVQIITRPGSLLPFLTSAQGKVALAWGRPELSGWIDSAPDAEALRVEIERTRELGWAVAPEQILPGVNAISAPIFDLERRLVATITIVGSLNDIAPEPAESYRVAVIAAAREISAELGCKEFPV